MIRNWFTAGRDENQPNRRQRRSQKELCRFEHLEDRRLLAFVGFFDGVTLDLVQTVDDGDVIVDNSGLGGAFRVTDNAGSLTWVAATNVSVSMLSNTANQLNFRIESTHTGNVVLNLGDGPRDVIFDGSGIPGIANTTGGDFTVNAGSGPQFVQLAPQTLIPIPFEVVGNTTFDLGDDFDTVYNNENFVEIGGNLDMTGVNNFIYTDFLFPAPLDADLKVGGNMTMDTSNESTESFLVEGGTFHDDDPDDPERSIIGGNFTYIGGDDIDHVNLNDTYIVGDVNIDLGEGIPFFGDPQNVTTTLTLPPILGGPYGQIDGNISIAADNSNLGNVITLDGVFNGNTVNFAMGDLVDDIYYALLGSQADITATMGLGNDTFEIKEGVNVLDIDFGNDFNDQLINSYGKFTFDSDITNFHQFDHLYTEQNDTLIMNQLINTGDVTISNDGGPVTLIDWKVSTPLGGTGSTTTAGNLTVNLLSNTGNDLAMDLINPVIASLTLNLGDGNRDVDFVGSSNNPLRDIVITADAGVQNVQLSENAALAVATLNVNLGSGFDTVDDNANNLLISEDLVFTGVNLFENGGVLSVARAAVVNSTVETENTTFANNGNMVVGSGFTYLGGDGRDSVHLNGPSTSITGNVSVDLGDNVLGGTQSLLLDGPVMVIGGNLTVSSTAFAHPDEFVTAPTTSITGNIDVNLGGGANTAIIVGVFSGNFINYAGSSGVDLVTLGTTGSPNSISIQLGSDDDTLIIQAGTSLASMSLLDVDFGDNNDTFINNFGLFEFDFNLHGLNGFNHLYSHSTTTLQSFQVSDRGPVTVDNLGPSDAFRFDNGGTQILVPASGMALSRLVINMQNNSGTNLDFQLDNPFTGDLLLLLGAGARTLNLTGTDNTIGGSLVIGGFDGDQVVNVAVNSGLGVGDDFTVDLGAGSDIVAAGGNNISVTGNLDMGGVNQFVNQATTTVGGHLSVDNQGEGDSLFDDQSTLSIAGDFTYQGGPGQDVVELNGTAGGSTVGGNVQINLGTNLGTGDQAALLNAPGTLVGGSLTVDSTNSSTADLVALDPAATYNGNIAIDLGGGTNTAEIAGNFGGSAIMYNGTFGVDTVTLGTTGNPADVQISLGQDDDTFTLLAGTSIAPKTLTVDFGDNNDTFDNQYGTLDFAFSLLGLDGFNFFFNQLTSTLTADQVSDPGPVTVDNNGVGNAIRFINGGINELVPTNNMNINMVDDSGTPLTLQLDHLFAGDLAIHLGSGNRSLVFDGNDNRIGGELMVTGTSGEQTVLLSNHAALETSFNALFDLGTGHDVVEHTNFGIDITGQLELHGVNWFGGSTDVFVGGNFMMDSIGDTVNSVFRPLHGGSFLVFGDFDYLGGDHDDSLHMKGTFQVDGDVEAHLGEGDNLIDFFDTLGTNSIVQGLTSVTALGGMDTFLSGDNLSQFGDNLFISLGNGQNEAVILGKFGFAGGTEVKYNGGIDRDDVTFGTTLNPAFVNIKLKTGDDNFTLNAGAEISPDTLRVDFGTGADTFVNHYGAFDFNAKLLNWYGYSRFYELDTDAWNIEQDFGVDTGPVVLDNNGTNNALRIIADGATTEMTPATEARLIMADNTTDDMTVDFDAPHSGLLVIQMRSGARELNFTGDSNTFGDLLRIEAADDVQNIYLARNADLNVGANLVINGREGFNSIDDSDHNITVGGYLILRNINNFVNNNALNVGGNFLVSNSASVEPTFLYNLGSIDVVGNLTYLGGTGVDDIQMNVGNVNIGEFAYFNLGTGDDHEATQYVNLQGGFSADTLGVVGGSSLGGNSVLFDGGTNVNGQVYVNFGASDTNNSALLYGNYGGANGSYIGGTAADYVSFGAAAPGMYFGAQTGPGDDVFVVDTGTELDYLFIDFGTGDDSLIDNLGQPWPFGSTIINL